jgi:Fur family ferric uptake transcriptional regulator
MSRSRISNISLATIYRNLEYWADKGEVRRLEVSGGKRRYDGDISQHYHSRCSICERIFDLKESDSLIVEKALCPLFAISGVEDVVIELKRVCDECAGR